MLFGIFVLSVLITSPAFVSADANAQCNPWFPPCPCKGGIMLDPMTGQCQGSGNTANCEPGVCQEQTPKGPVKGICVAPGKCEGKLTAEGKGVGLGQAGQFFQQAMQGIQQAMQGMKGGGGGGGGGQQQGGQQGGQQSGLGGLLGNTPWTTGTCTGTQYDVSYPSTDPCARYKQPTSEALLGGQTGAGSSLLNQLTGGNGSSQVDSTGGGGGDGLDTANDQTSASEAILRGGSNTQSSAQSVGTASNSQTAAQTGTSATNTGVTTSGDVAGMVPGGPRGDITADQAGLTITAGSRDVPGNSEVAGFFGASTGNAGLSKSIIGRWCATRPWATNFLGKIVPAAVFDGLCTRAGYKVGEESAASGSGDIDRPPVTVLQQKRNSPRATTTPAQATSTGPVPPGRVQIWAVPSAVSLGSRTSIFWATENVTGCTETSSDGNFNQSSLSGGASTVPLAGPTTFIISCRDGAGVEIKGSVTVTIKH